MKSDQILRHSLAVRIGHWLIATSGLLLCLSGIGFMPLYGRFYLNAVPGLHWISNFETQMHLHYLAAMVFSAAVCFHLVFHLRRREFAALPRQGDLRESGQLLRAMLSGGEEPPHGKFLAEQRLAYLAIGLVSLLLIATGLVLSWKNGGQVVPDPTFIQWVTLLHLAATFLFLALVATHLAGLLLKANRPLLPSMLTGKVRREYAERRHARWKV